MSDQAMKFDSVRTPLQAFISPGMTQPKGDPPVAGPVTAVLFDKPIQATQCNLVYTPPQASTQFAAPQASTLFAAGPVGHAAGESMPMVLETERESTLALATYFRGNAGSDTTKQPDLDKTVSCWPCEIKHRV